MTRIPPHIAITYQPRVTYEHRPMTTPTPDRPTQPPAVPDALRRQWHGEWNAKSLYTSPIFGPDRERHMVGRAAAWAWTQREEEVREAEQRGANAELEACCEWLTACNLGHLAANLRTIRRPAPPTLREQALAVVDKLGLLHRPSLDEIALIREALQESADG